MAYAEKRGKGPRPWRVKYKIPAGEASQSGFETKQAALAWGRDQEAKVRAGTWTDPGAGAITVSEWIGRWQAMQDVGPSTVANREYRIRRFILPYWGKRKLNSLTGEDIAAWEHKLHDVEGMSRSTAKDARGLLHTILGDAAAAKPPLIPFNPAVRPRNRGRRTGRRLLDRSAQRAWATPLDVLLVAERAALLAGRDDEFTMLVTIGYTGMRWGETIGLECDLLLPSQINLEWQLREINGRFHRIPPKDDSYRSTNVEPFVPVDIPPFLAELLTGQARARRRCPCAAGHGGSDRYMFLGSDGGHHRRSNFARRVFRPASTGGTRQPKARQAGWSWWTRRRGQASRSRRGRQRYPASRSFPRPAGVTPADQHGELGPLPSLRVRGQVAAGREDHRPQERCRRLPRQRRAACQRRAAGLLAAGQGRADASWPQAQPQDMDG